MSLPEALERAAEALPADADLIRPANGDPVQLLSTLDGDASRRVLVWMLTNEPTDGEELLLDWCEDDRGVERVQEVDVSQLPKSGKKMLRKVLHRMRTSGVEVAAAAKSALTENTPGGRTEVADEIGGAYLTPVDPRGSVLLFLVEANPTGGARLFQILLCERRGVVEFDAYNTGRSKTRSFLRRLTDASRAGAAGAVKVNPALARGLVARVAAGHPVDRPFPRSFSEWRRKIEAGGSDQSLADFVREASGGSLADAGTDGLERIASKIRASTLGPWPPESTQLTECSTALGIAIDDVLTKEGAAREGALEAALIAATESLFDGAHASETAARFEASAVHALISGNEEDVRDCIAAAQSLRTSATGTNPIARAMTETLTASTLKRAEEPQPTDPSQAASTPVVDSETDSKTETEEG